MPASAKSFLASAGDTMFTMVVLARMRLLACRVPSASHQYPASSSSCPPTHSTALETGHFVQLTELERLKVRSGHAKHFSLVWKLQPGQVTPRGQPQLNQQSAPHNTCGATYVPGLQASHLSRAGAGMPPGGHVSH